MRFRRQTAQGRVRQDGRMRARVCGLGNWGLGNGGLGNGGLGNWGFGGSSPP